MSKKNEQTNEPPDPLPEPITEEVRRIRDNVSQERWLLIVREAQDKVRIIHELKAKQKQSSESWRKCLQQVDPEVSWSRYSHWHRNCKARSGPEWERLLDRRVPPNAAAVSPEIRSAIIALRQADPRMNCETARKHLISQFQERGDFSDRTIRREWSVAGLTRPPGEGDASRFEKVERFHGGGGLALIGVAAVETGAVESLALAAQEAGRSNASAQEEFTPKSDFDGRDEHGRFTDMYNHILRIGIEPGTADSRWKTDAAKRERCDLGKLAVLRMKPETLGQHMFAIGMIPFLTERRGFDGLDGHNAQWLEVLGLPAYKPSTLDKTLFELALLNVGDGLWSKHGQFWVSKALEWSEGQVFWRQFIVYVDITTEPYWTKKYALSGKVTRLGRVMPCLSRIALAGGPGVPLLIETRAGTVSLKKTLVDVLEKADAAMGPCEIRRLTVVDAEAQSVKLLAALKDMEDRAFVTVLKGPGAKGVGLEWPGSWEPYREHDLIRSGTVTLQGKGAPAGGLQLRGVEMKREGSRHPRSTLFVTGVPPKIMTSAEVADAYLSRWPNQEQFFRESRNGAGFAHTHGYGGEYVTNVALETKLEKSERQLVRAEKCVKESEGQVKGARTLLKCAQESTQVKAANEAVRRAEEDGKNAKKQLNKACEEHHELSTMPRLIYKRDATRENIVTVFTLTILLLIEFVLREYFGNLKMELRTFIECFLYAPTTVRTSHYQIIYQIEGNPRNRGSTEQLCGACQEITRRKLRKNGRLLVFEVVDPPGQFP